MPSSHLILCLPLLLLLLLLPISPSIRVFSNESTLRMRWPKYWSFSVSIIPSKEIPGLISGSQGLFLARQLTDLWEAPMTGQVWPRSGTPPGGQNQWVPASGSSLPGMTATGGLAPGPGIAGGQGQSIPRFLASTSTCTVLRSLPR